MAQSEGRSSRVDRKHCEQRRGPEPSLACGGRTEQRLFSERIRWRSRAGQCHDGCVNASDYPVEPPGAGVGHSSFRLQEENGGGRNLSGSSCYSKGEQWESQVRAPWGRGRSLRWGGGSGARSGRPGFHCHRRHFSGKADAFGKVRKRSLLWQWSPGPIIHYPPDPCRVPAGLRCPACCVRAGDSEQQGGPPSKGQTASATLEGCASLL